jgi:hypothetical protein
MGCEIKGESVQGADNQHMVQLSGGHANAGIIEGKGGSTESLRFIFEYNDLTDVMFVDLAPVQNDSRVIVVDIGDEIGFAGQVQVRVDIERQIFYGLTIQNYSGFKRKLLWRYRMWSIQSAILLLIQTLMAGLNIDRSSHRHALPCL